MPKSKILGLILKEVERQRSTLNLIPSENYVSTAVLRVLASPLTNKYSEGSWGKRYYPGNCVIDDIERYTQELALKAFKLSPKIWSVNVQAYSGSPANLAAYLALMAPGDRLLGLSLSSGGHLTHGHPASFTGKLFRVARYEVDPKTERIDYDALARLAKQFRPKVIVSGTTSYPRQIDFQRIGKIARSVRAYHVADISHIAGLVLAGLHPSPFPHADIVTTTTHKTLRGPRGALIMARREFESAVNRAVFPGLQGGPHNHQTAAIGIALEEALRPNFRRYQQQIIRNAQALATALRQYDFRLFTGGTDNHLMLIDLKPFGLTGQEAEQRLEQAAITANRNALPGDASPFNPSGLRLGTPAVTTRGLREREMHLVADWLQRLLMTKEPPARIGREVRTLLRRFPLAY